VVIVEVSTLETIKEKAALQFDGNIKKAMRRKKQPVLARTVPAS